MRIESVVKTLLIGFFLSVALQATYAHINMKGFKEGYQLGVEAGYAEFMEHYEETCNELPPENAEALCWKILYNKYGVKVH